SADGRYVAYSSQDLGPWAWDTNGVRDIFVHDGQTGEITPVSVTPDARFTNQFHSDSCVLSATGRRVAWVLTAPGFFNYSSILWHDLDSNETRVVSHMLAE